VIIFGICSTIFGLHLICNSSAMQNRMYKMKCLNGLPLLPVLPAGGGHSHPAGPSLPVFKIWRKRAAGHKYGRNARWHKESPENLRKCNLRAKVEI